MDYYTNFSITIKARITRTAAEFICERLNELTDWEQFSVDSDGASPMEERDIWELEPYDELKRDDWEDHMTILANQFNEVEFHVERNGENEEDWLVALFKGDKKQIRYGFPPSQKESKKI